MSRTSRLDLAAIAVTVAVIAGIGFALVPKETGTITVDPSAVQVDRPQTAAATTSPSVLFIGDSYTAGRGLSEMSYGCMAAVRMGWICNLSAVPGTGYMSGGQANRFRVSRYLGMSTSFMERIPDLAAVYQPDIVVLDGGRNDLFPPAESVFKAMTATIEEARRAWPKANIVFIRPRFLSRPGDDLGFGDAFIRRLQNQPGAAGVVFLDPIKRLTKVGTSTMLTDDGIHPNQRGDVLLSQLLLESMLNIDFANPT
jgi:lysophospholipase L1-like esterase